MEKLIKYRALDTQTIINHYGKSETLISAIQKQVIKDVVLYVDKKLGKSL